MPILKRYQSSTYLIWPLSICRWANVPVSCHSPSANCCCFSMTPYLGGFRTSYSISTSWLGALLTVVRFSLVINENELCGNRMPVFFNTVRFSVTV
ncbi:hypothetical protein DPMN_110441 [Dreissena polymorpha]|uniref:Uncharacterized protein n=1 Tax=Dreissena polymorpha TaxID=45954 RepID=A0A9D4KCK9_DREPO|nr:hypothetical protein DPMN_110441 [Dreissena polymorpha]